MTWVKICGITNIEDALTAVDAGADALGFVFYEKSPRNITTKMAREIVQQLPARIEKVGVFVTSHMDDYVSIIEEAGLTASQIHMAIHMEPNVGRLGATAYGSGCFPPGFKSYWSLPAAFFIENESGARNFIASLIEMRTRFQSQPEGDMFARFFETIFVDSGTLEQPGGTGKFFNWEKASEIFEYLKRTTRVVVAGGLTPDNVDDAIRILHPWGVDVSSGVEASPGKKDQQKVRAFVQAVRRSENN